MTNPRTNDGVVLTCAIIEAFAEGKASNFAELISGASHDELQSALGCAAALAYASFCETKGRDSTLAYVREMRRTVLKGDPWTR